MTADLRIAIVGAGIMGRLLAWELVRAGYRPQLYDRDAADTGSAAANTAAGMLAPYCELEAADSIIHHMGLAGLAQWRRLARELGDSGYRDTGTLVLAHAAERVELQRFQLRLRHKLAAATAVRPATGNDRQATLLQGAALARREPALDERFDTALYLPDEACVDNRRVMAALAQKLRQHGVVWHTHTPVLALEPGRIVLPQGSRAVDWVFDCRGLGARDDLPALRGVRGELLEISAPAVPLRHMLRLLHPRYQIYLVPLCGGRYLIGATQIESEDYAPISVRSALELLSALYSLHEGFAEANIIATRSNCRPALPDNLPLIQHQPGLLRINGLFRHGFLLAPVLASQALHYLQRGLTPAMPWPTIFRQGRAAAPSASLNGVQT